MSAYPRQPSRHSSHWLPRMVAFLAHPAPGALTLRSSANSANLICPRPHPHFHFRSRPTPNSASSFTPALRLLHPMPSFWTKVAGYPAQVTARADTGTTPAEVEAAVTARASSAVAGGDNLDLIAPQGINHWIDCERISVSSPQSSYGMSHTKSHNLNR